jgi:hypothetical protein
MFEFFGSGADDPSSAENTVRRATHRCLSTSRRPPEPGDGIVKVDQSLVEIIPAGHFPMLDKSPESCGASPLRERHSFGTRFSQCIAGVHYGFGSHDHS